MAQFWINDKKKIRNMIKINPFIRKEMVPSRLNGTKKKNLTIY
jgi:hypothetical protein